MSEKLTATVPDNGFMEIELVLPTGDVMLLHINHFEDTWSSIDVMPNSEEIQTYPFVMQEGRVLLDARPDRCVSQIDEVTANENTTIMYKRFKKPKPMSLDDARKIWAAIDSRDLRE